MREIKFKLWSERDKKMYLDPGADVLIHGINEQFTCDDEIWLQYTGLKDCNGVEIYEGDIIRTDLGVINKISWFRSGWIFNNPITNPNALVRFSDNVGIESELEVIGNIYQNPELLTN